MRETTTVRELIHALGVVEDELRAARCTADTERLTILVRRKQCLLRQLRLCRLGRLGRTGRPGPPPLAAMR